MTQHLNDDAAQQDSSFLNSSQLAVMEASFRNWAETGRADKLLARRRILLIFLLIRYGGVKLNEVLAVELSQAFSSKDNSLHISGGDGKGARSIALGEHIGGEIRLFLQDSSFCEYLARHGLRVDPAFVRRKFYERAEDCGFAKQLGSPEMIRRARAVELMQGHVPLPAVHKFLGQATAYTPFDDAALQDMTAWFVEQEGKQLSSARNTLYGRVTAIQQGTIQALVEISTIGQGCLRAIITVGSLKRLQLREGRLVTAEIKAPWLHLCRVGSGQALSADNCFSGEIIRMTAGSLIVEYIVRSKDGIEFCALLSRPATEALALDLGDQAWVFFSAFAVVLHTEPLPAAQPSI